MRVLICLIFSLVCFMSSVSAMDKSSSQLSALQNVRNYPKLYAPNFVLIGNKATFKVISFPRSKVKLILDYGSTIPRQILEADTNEKGIAVFNTLILDNEELVGKSVALEALIVNKHKPDTYTKAILINEKGTPANSNRIYIADKDSAKGVMVTPWKSLNNFIMTVDYDEESGFNPFTDFKYDDTTPVYIRNMRDAQENVREIPTHTNNSNW